MHKLVLIRHGESTWNEQNLFTGWTDVDLSDTGVKEARKAGKILKKEGYTFDMTFTSYLKRAKKTLNITLEEMDQLWLPVEKHWRLNERHYGALQGLNKKETARKEGKEQVHIWRRSYDTRPPALIKSDKRYPGNQQLYRQVDKQKLPVAESLKDTVERFLPYWKQAIVPQLKKGKRLVISAHGNSLRALVKHLDKVADDEIPGLEIPTGKPLVYELNDQLKPEKHYYLE